MIFRVFSLVYALVILRSVGSVAALGTNRTIDDQLGDSVTGVVPIYLPPNVWSQGNQCSSCFAQPDSGSAFGHTWHDVSVFSSSPEDDVNVTMKFTGTAIYAYCILVNNNTYASFTNLTFSIDGKHVGSFSHAPDGSNTYQYNALVYANAAIPNDDHTFVIHSPRGVMASMVLFDYVVYTYSGRPSAGNTGAVAGGVISGVIVLALVAGAIIFVLRRRKIIMITPWTPAMSGLVVPQGSTKIGPYAELPSARRPSSTFDSQRMMSLGTSPQNEAYVPDSAQLLHRLEDRQRMLARLQGGPVVPSLTPEPATQSQVEDLRSEVERLRELVTNMGITPPPQYEG